MKVYWSETGGVVVTSANLSTNALGVGDLKEAGVLLGPESLDIDELLAPLSLRPAAPELHALDLAHRDYYRRHPQRQKHSQASFAQWFRTPARQEWKLLVCEEFCDEMISRASRDYSQTEIGREPTAWAWSAKRTVKENEWVLCAALRREDSVNFGWLYIDHIQKVPPGDGAYSKHYPYELVQLRPLKTYEPPPFAVDLKFKKAFRDAAAKLEITSETESPFSPRNQLLETLDGLMAK